MIKIHYDCNLVLLEILEKMMQYLRNLRYSKYLGILVLEGYIKV